VNQNEGAAESARNGELLAMLDSDDEALRAEAAVALARRGHPYGLQACLRTIADAPEPGHAYSTPAGWQLVTIGLPALSGLFECLLSDNPQVRLCANHAVMQITKRQFSFDGMRWPEGEYERWAYWWHDIAYALDAPAALRELAVGRLRAACGKWLAA
jgi:hypothetical protein